MKYFLEMNGRIHDELWGHLLPLGAFKESAAFLFVEPVTSNGFVRFRIKDRYLAKPEDFAHQYSDYLELSDEARMRLIKSAHQLGLSIVEMHSHTGPFPAGFSVSDRMGLKETVPHMFWRLKRKPYAAIVVTRSGFDALLWWDNPKIPRAMDGLIVDDEILMPTNNSLEGWT